MDTSWSLVVGSLVLVIITASILFHYHIKQRQNTTGSSTAESRDINSASKLPLHREIDANRFRNKAAVDTVLPQILCKIIKWGCKKKDTETYLCFLQKNKSKDVLEKQWKIKREQALLDTSELDSRKCDVSFLNKLFQDVCDKPDSSGKKQKDYDTMKFYVTKIVEIRNNVSHEPMGAAISSSILNDIKEITGKLFHAASKVYDVGGETIAKERDNVSGLLNEIQNKTMTDKQAKFMEIGNLLSSEGKNEMKKIVDKQAKEFLPFSKVLVNRSSVFHPSRLRVEQSDEEKNQKRSPDDETGDNSDVLSCTQLFSNLHSQCVIIIHGHPGSGKSTVLRRLREDFLSEKAEIFKGVRKFEILLYMECRKKAKTIPDLLKYNFPETLQKIEAEDAVDALVTRKVLILVDGIDEANSNSNKLLLKLIEVYGSRESVKIVFTSRPGAARPFKERLADEGITITEVTLQPLTEENEKIEFLKQYQETIETINASELIDAYKSLDEICKQHLIQPVHLALFCHLFNSSPDDVRKWKNELSIMDQTLKVSRQLISDRLHGENVNNYEKIADQLIHKSFYLSVRQIAHNQMTIKQEAYLGLFKNLPETKGKSEYKIISSLFVSQTDQNSFEYLHKTHAEYLAAKALFKELTKPNKTSIFTVISEILDGVSDGSVTHQNDTKRRMMETRFSHAFRFLLMELDESEDDHSEILLRCLDEFCPILAKEKMSIEYWLDLTASCPSSEPVARAAAEAAKESTEWEGWTVSSDRHMQAAARMLPYFQPPELTVWPLQPTTMLLHLTELLQEAAKWHKGRVRLELTDCYRTGTPADNLLDLLKSAECKIIRFKGCLRSKTSQRFLCQAARRAEKDVLLFISLIKPREHELSKIRKVEHGLVVRASLTDRTRCRRPLPGGSRFPPSLTVVCTAATEWTEVQELIEDLAPEYKTRNNDRTASRIASKKSITFPMNEKEQVYIYEKDEAIAEENDFKPDLGGKWILWFPLDSMNSMWRKSCLLYRERKLKGIQSIKSSTAKFTPRQNTTAKGVIMFTCGPSDNEDLIKSYGRVIVEELDYFDEIDNISYKSADQSKKGTRATGNTDIFLYKIPVPQSRSREYIEELSDSEEESATEDDTNQDISKGCLATSPAGISSHLLTEIQEEKMEEGQTMQYYALWLQDWQGAEDDLGLLVRSLSVSGVRTTVGSGEPRWAPAENDRRGRCEVCERIDHGEDNERRCVRLFLPYQLEDS